jgi:hypothetical protein
MLQKHFDALSKPKCSDASETKILSNQSNIEKNLNTSRKALVLQHIMALG